MSAENDIVERLRALSRREHDDLSIGDEAAAEIVRLRGEVAERADDLTTAYMAGRFDGKAIAPAEAKGDWQYESMRFLAYKLRQMSAVGFDADTCADAASWLEKLSSNNPQPAGGEAVMVQQAWEWAGGNPGIKATPELLQETLRELDALVDGISDTTPPAAQVQQEAKPHRCDYCGKDYGNVACCNARYEYLRHFGETIEPPATHPAGDALGAGRAALERFVADAVETDVRGGDVVITTCESLELARAALRLSAGEGKGHKEEAR